MIIFIENATAAVCKYFFAERIVKPWNSLPDNNDKNIL